MPTVANTLKTYDQVGKKEDIEDIIYDISPHLTPFTSSIGTSTATATLHQWQSSELAAVGTNAAVEGADAGAASNNTTTTHNNHTQIFTKVVQSSGTSEAVATYGRNSDLQMNIAMKGKELRRDIEHAFVGNNQTGTAGNSTTARKLESAQGQIDSSTKSLASSNRTFTESLLLDVMQSVYEAGGDPNQIQVTPSHSVIIAGFAASAGRTRDFGHDKRITHAVDLFVSPFSECAVVPNRWLNQNQVLILDTEYWSRAVLRPMQTVMLSKTGDSDKRQMLTELTLVCENSKASGYISELTP